jgi:hypothetical protein
VVVGVLIGIRTEPYSTRIKGRNDVQVVMTDVRGIIIRAVSLGMFAQRIKYGLGMVFG